MATIIDALLVTLGMDSSGFKKGAKEAYAEFEKLRKEAEDAAYEFKKQQQAAKAAFESQARDAVKSGKITQEEYKRSSNAFKQKQQDEAYAFKKSQKNKIDASRKEYEEINKGEKEREAQAKNSAQAVGKIRNQVLALAVAYLGLKAIKGFADEIISADTHLSRVSGAIGESTSTLNAWETAAGKFGASAEDVEGAFRNTLKLQQELREGKIDSFQPFVQMLASKGVGFDPAKLFDRNLSSQERQLEISKIVSQLSEQDAVIALQKLGYSEQYAQFLHSGADAVKQSVEDAKKLRPNIDAAGKEANKLSQNWIDIKQRIFGVGDALLLDLGPAIETAQKWFDKLTSFAQEHITATEVVVGLLSASITALSVVISVKGIGSIFQFVGALKTVSPAATEAAVATGTTLTSSIAGLAKNAGLLAAAGAVGYAIGTAIYESMSKETQDKIGGSLTKLLAKLGNKDAQEALDLAAKGQVSGTSLSQDAFNRDQVRKRAAGQATSTSSKFDPLQAAIESEKKYGVPASVTYAQYQLESGNGSHMPTGSNNPFGIKARSGQPYVEAETPEVINGVSQRVMAKFAKFDSLQDAFDAHARLLATSSYYKKAQGDTSDPLKYADDLQGIYATDPGYAKKLKNLIANGPVIDKDLLTGASASQAVNSTSNNNNTQNTHQIETHIENVNINAPNAKTNGDVASAFADKFKNYAFGSMANYGLTA